VQEAGATTDLLTLIGHAIDRLQRCIVLFEGCEMAGGVDNISAVVIEIDEYLEHADEDPLLRLASLPPAHVRDGLVAVQSDLTSIIDEVRRPHV
jgi:hypothetical protein